MSETFDQTAPISYITPAIDIDHELGHIPRRRLSWATNSNSTISDAPGPGRTVNALLTLGAPYVEQLVGASHQRPPDPPSVPPLPPPALSQISLVSDSNDTIPDISGAGSTMHGLLSWAGRILERKLTGVMVRMGRGPASSIAGIVDLVARSRRSVSCPYCGHSFSAQPLLAAPSSRLTPNVLEWIVSRSTISCEECKRPFADSKDYPVERTQKYCKKLVRMLRYLFLSFLYFLR
jgi:hypothetical protein